MESVKYLILLACFISLNAFAEEPMIEEFDRPNAISAELLGRGYSYSIAYDRLVSNQLGLGLGFSYYVSSGLGITHTDYVFPIYANYYLSTDSQRFFLTGGISLLYESRSSTLSFSSTTLSSSDTTSFFNFGGGYESRSESGFLFRATAYLLFGSGVKYFFSGKSLMPWIGLSFGKVF